MVEIRLIKGPLSLDQLELITQLYGLVDKKYASLGFCTYLYNQNPYGFSYHAFAYVDNQPVGHIALIPMLIDTPAGRKSSLKSESLYLQPEFRDSWINYKGEELPLNLAMPKVINDFALKGDFKVIHLLADDEIGKIHIFAGCQKIPVALKESFLIINEKEYTRRESTLQRKLLITLTALFQRTISYTFCNIFSLLHQSNCRIKVIEDTKKILPALTVKNPWQWSIALTDEYQSWLEKSPFIKVCVYADSLDDYIVFKESEYPHRTTEIIGCYSKDNDWLRLVKILQCIISDARDKQASSVNLKHFPNQVYPQALFTSLQILGFLTKNTKLSCYVKSNEPDYLKKENLAYCPFFYIQF